MKPDYGIALSNDGVLSETIIHFHNFPFSNITIINEKHFSIFLNIDYKGISQALSTDFDLEIMKELLLIIPPEMKENIESTIGKPAFFGNSIDFKETKYIRIATKLGKLQISSSENYIPLIIQEIHDLPNQEKN